MIGYLHGTVSHLFNEYCFIDVQGVGYRVFISSATRQALAVNAPATLFTYLNVREDALMLFGFKSTDEYDLFMQLISITGVGPKVAMGVLSAVTPAGFRGAVANKDTAMLTRIPGIGKKTAERMILELKDKVGLPEDGGATAARDLAGGFAGPQDEAGEALAALVALGYSQGEVLPILNRVKADGMSVQELIKLTLKEVGRR